MSSPIYEYYVRLLTSLTNEEIINMKSHVDYNYILYLLSTQDKTNSSLSQYSQLKYIFDGALAEVLKLKFAINNFFVSD